MSSYDDPRWYERSEQQEQPKRSEQTEQSEHPQEFDRFPQRIHNDVLNTSQAEQSNARTSLSQKYSPGQSFRDEDRRNDGYRSGGSGGLGGNASRKFGQITVTIALLLIAFTGGWFSHQVYTSSLLSTNNQSAYYANLFQQAWTIVDQNYVDRKAINYKQMSYAAIRAMLGVLNDTGHTYFLTPDQVPHALANGVTTSAKLPAIPYGFEPALMVNGAPEVQLKIAPNCQRSTTRETHEGTLPSNICPGPKGNCQTPLLRTMRSIRSRPLRTPRATSPSTAQAVRS